MRGLDRILSAALVAAIAGSSLVAWAATQGGGDGDQGPGIESRVPTPTPAEVKPPTSADVAAPTPQAAPDLKPSAPPDMPANIKQGAAPETKPSAPPDIHQGAAPQAAPNAPPDGRQAADAKGGTTADTGPTSKSAASPPNSGVQDAAGPRTTPAGSTPSSVAPAEPPATAAAPPAAASPTATAPAAPASAPGAKPEPAAAATPAAKDNGKPLATNLAAADVPVAEKLRDLVAGRLDRIFERKSDRQVVETFYVNRGFAPLWIEGGVASPRALSAVARLKAAAADGLDPSDYPTPDFSAATDHPDVLADDELKLTSAALIYARHAQIGRVHFSRVSPDIFYNLVAPDPREVLSRLAQSKDAGEALGAYNPPQEGFKELRAKLAELRGQGETALPARIANGSLLKVGVEDDRVPLLRQRLHVLPENGASTYDKSLSEAIRTFQRQHDLKPTGNLNAATVEALNGGVPHGHAADILIANMERWRWLPRDLGKTYVMVNIPDYTLKVVHNGTTVWRTRIVVGKPSTPTPLLSEPMKYITVNPTWNVPPSIVQNEYLPALQQDPDALARIGLEVEYNADGSLHIFQPPGEANALGRLRFNFPNKFLVYQHDTPDKNLFAREKRAYSHGCMRVQDPLDYAQVLLGYAAPNEGYTAERIRRMFGSDEYDINFSTLIPVHITYQTAFTDESGKLELREDVYGRDARTLAVLRGEDRRIADIPLERREMPRRQAVRMPRPYYSFPGGSPFRDTGLSFFERLFH